MLTLAAGISAALLALVQQQPGHHNENVQLVKIITAMVICGGKIVLIFMCPVKTLPL